MSFTFSKQSVLNFCTLFFTFICGLQWAEINVVSLFLIWIIQICYIYMAFSFYDKDSLEIADKSLLKLYLCWIFISVIRGALFYTLGNYWIWKSLIFGTFDVLLPSLLYIYSRPKALGGIIKSWLKYSLLFFLCLLPFISKGAYHFYLGPLYIVAFFWPVYAKKWRLIILILMLLMLTADMSARSQVIKTGVVLLLSMGYLLRRYVPLLLLKFVHWVCYIVPIILLVLGITGTFNVFEDFASNEGKFIEKKIDKDGRIVEEDLSTDTRTFIFKEIISSAINNNYVICGRTPARGNDSEWFGSYNAEDLKTGLYERHSNETGLPSLFTWLGLIGLILISLIYLRSSYLAVYCSSNIFMKYLGCFVAFRWAYGWIEDMYSFSPMILSLFMIMGMCMSPKFRSMNNEEMKNWLLSLVDFRKKR